MRICALSVHSKYTDEWFAGCDDAKLSWLTEYCLYVTSVIPFSFLLLFIFEPRHLISLIFNGAELQDTTSLISFGLIVNFFILTLWYIFSLQISI